MNIHRIIFDKRGRSAQTFLALVFLIGGIITFVGITLAFLAASFIDSGYGLKASLTAEQYAFAGARDGLLQVERNPSFSYPSGYPVAVGSSTATVFVTQNDPITGEVTIYASSSFAGRVKRVNAIISVNPTTTQITVLYWYISV